MQLLPLLSGHFVVSVGGVSMWPSLFVFLARPKLLYSFLWLLFPHGSCSQMPRSHNPINGIAIFAITFETLRVQIEHIVITNRAQYKLQKLYICFIRTFIISKVSEQLKISRFAFERFVCESRTTLASDTSPNLSKCFLSSFVVTSCAKSPTNIWWSSKANHSVKHKNKSERKISILLTRCVLSNAIRSRCPVYFHILVQYTAAIHCC